MDLKDMILVTENDRGTETNMLMTLDDYKSFIAIDDMSELAENLLQLGRTLGEADNFTEYYRAANVTVSARFCLDDIQLGHFLQGFYNDSKEFRFDKEASSSECVAKLKEIGMTDKGWVDDFNLHYEMENRSFERGQTFHNFNDHDYMVLEALSPRNLVVMDMKSGSLTIALGATEYKRYPKDEKPTKDNTTIGVSWEHGIYLGSTLSTTNFKAYKREYGTPEKIEDIYDYRAKLKQKFYFYQDMSKDDDVPKKLQNDFLHQMYEDFGTIEEDCFYDRLEDAYARIKEPEKEETQKQERTQEMPEFSVTVTPYEREGSNIKGLARIYFENSFIVNNINIVQGKEKIFVSMPSYKTKQVDEQGKPIYQDVCYPVTKDFREKLYNEIISEYEKAKDKSNENARESAEKHHGNPDKEKDKEATPFR
nr:SpoVG family protein [Coprococcus sp. OM04-5BH]